MSDEPKATSREPGLADLLQKAAEADDPHTFRLLDAVIAHRKRVRSYPALPTGPESA